MTTNTASAIFAGITPCSSASCIVNTSCCSVIVISPAALPSLCCVVIVVLCRRRHCDAVVVVHCSTPFDASDALAPMNCCATARLARLLASLEWLHAACLLAPCLPDCSHRVANSGASELSATASATLTVITSHYHIVTPNHLRI